MPYPIEMERKVFLSIAALFTGNPSCKSLYWTASPKTGFSEFLRQLLLMTGAVEILAGNIQLHVTALYGLVISADVTSIEDSLIPNHVQGDSVGLPMNTRPMYLTGFTGRTKAVPGRSITGWGFL